MLKLTIILFGLVAASSATFDRSLDALWNGFKTRFSRKYTNVAEEIHRRMAFEQTVTRITKHNVEADLGWHSYRMGLNQFADLTPSEYRKTMLGTARSNLTNQLVGYISPAKFYPGKLPTSVDWRKKGYVTPVMDQGQCGDCWAISPLSALEGQHKAVSGKLVPLSVANLVDCVPDSQGCAGGTIDSAYKYMIQYGVDTEACYPVSKGKCAYNASCVGATMKGVASIESGSEEKLQVSAAAIGPISVAIDASQISFQSYVSGVYDDPNCSSTQLDHGVLVVGYGVLDGKDYWIVKNSWGVNWGMKGYILMSRNKHNQCGIATMASYPTQCGQ